MYNSDVDIYVSELYGCLYMYELNAQLYS